MTKSSGLGDYFLVDGYDLSGDIGALSSIHGGPAALAVTGINKLGVERVGGERDAAIEFQAWFNDATAQAHPVLSALPTTDRYASYLHGQALGNPMASCLGLQIDYGLDRAGDGALTVASSVQSDGYGLEWGIQATPGLRADTTATNGSSIDNTAATNFGLQAYLHVSAFTGTSVTVKLQDSADNSSWSDVTGGAFTAATARGAQRIATANNLTVRRYLRVATSGTFSAATFVVQVVRNETTVAF